MSAFGDAFKAARGSGKKVFTFNGKKYNTRTKDDEAKSAKKNTAAVSKSAGQKITARAKTPNTQTRTVAKAPAKTASQKRRTAGVGVPPPSKVGAAHKRQVAARPKPARGQRTASAKAHTGTPLRSAGNATPAAKPKPKVSAKRDTVVLNRPKASPNTRAKRRVT